MKKSVYGLTVVGFILFGNAIIAKAQTDMMPQINTGLNNIQNTMANEALTRSRNNMEALIAENRRLTLIEERGAQIIKAGKATTAFTRTNQMLSSQDLANRFEQSEQQIEKLMREFDAEVKRRGGATNDAACVNAAAFALVWEVYTDGKVKLNQQQFNWILKEMQKDVLGMQGYQGYSNAEKQRYYEAVAIDTMIIYEEYRLGRNSAELKAKAKENLADIFTPRKLEDYDLTATGFVKVR